MVKKVGILGGTFDPPHLGHLQIAKEVIKQLNLDEIWFMPNGEPPHKEKSTMVTNEDRLNMLQLTISNYPQFKINSIEIEQAGKSYTYETMKRLVVLYPNTKFYFIIGADMIEYLPQWYKVTELLELVTFVGVNRPNYSYQSDYPVLLVNIPDINISSSLIRESLQSKERDEKIKQMINCNVLAYIRENNLYGS